MNSSKEPAVHLHRPPLPGNVREFLRGFPTTWWPALFVIVIAVAIHDIDWLIKKGTAENAMMEEARCAAYFKFEPTAANQHDNVSIRISRAVEKMTDQVPSVADQKVRAAITDIVQKLNAENSNEGARAKAIAELQESCLNSPTRD
ncbi:hypothetical protein DYI21_01820 [Thalassospira tepidiphila]|nr:hypothetical protein [Thalassospira tepidiphila]